MFTSSSVHHSQGSTSNNPNPMKVIPRPKEICKIIVSCTRLWKAATMQQDYRLKRFHYALCLALPWMSSREHGLTPQISRAYSAMLRSDENIPDPAVDMMDIFVHLARFLYVLSTFSCTIQVFILSPFKDACIPSELLEQQPQLSEHIASWDCTNQLQK